MTRRIPIAIGVMLSLAACGEEPPAPVTRIDPLVDGRRYVEEPAFRRQALEASLVNPQNGYSQLRLAAYTDDDWGALPEWNPPTRPMTSDDFGPYHKPLADGTWQPIEVEKVPFEESALVELGRQAFLTYPVQLMEALHVALDDESTARRVGIAPDQAGQLGTIWVNTPRGEVIPALTCASCHSTVDPSTGRRTLGQNNADLNVGRMLSQAGGTGDIDGWGPGRVDVTSDGEVNPTAITDLRSVRSQQNLHRAATLRNGLIPLAIRLETLIITSNRQSIRPPRKLALAMALFLFSLEPQPVQTPTAASERGKEIFSTSCAGCHRPSGGDFSGPALPLAAAGTDPSVGLSPERTTGTYRVPSLRGVGDRRRLLAAGGVEDLPSLLDPARLEGGHTFGQELDPASRADLLAYLQTL